MDKFVYLLENGYDTVVGGRGGKLSDGQRQRIAIARAVIRKPKILVLDEATSGVDSQTEEEIFDELKEEDMTLIIISHRLSTIRKADRVLVLNEGRVVEEGTHEELMASFCVYKDIIQSRISCVNLKGPLRSGPFKFLKAGFFISVLRKLLLLLQVQASLGAFL